MAPLIRVIGSLNADMVSVTPRFPDPGETITSSSYFTSAGGKGAKQAVACGRMSRAKPIDTTKSTGDVNVEIMGAIRSRPVPSESRRESIHGVAMIIVDSSAGGENCILFSPGANYDGMQPTPEVLGMALAAPVPDVIVMQGEIPVNTTIGILREIASYKSKARAAGKRGIECGPDVMLNPAPAPPGGLPEDVYAAVDHLILNETEAGLMTPPAEQLLRTVPDAEGLDGKEKVARVFHKLGVTYILITFGAKGVWYSAADGGWSEPSDGVQRFTNEIPAASVSQLLDTTGAGDTFVGAYAVRVVRWREQRRVEGKAGQNVADDERAYRYKTVMDEAMRLAARASARAVERRGAMDSIPFEDEV
ncbi:Ribokinase [Penicillium cf. griseofulvum]|uniref:Ribokinase n=1 Tax=Penicillium cf. griseofulvum TaxID=2972120 RepID=A0A9W9LX29_9EURO|nr:Ribokinase [Penicillium cf. griseofulvum]KAJ5451627.1 Ribokinase [Penicillium cf. griseofulvum]